MRKLVTGEIEDWDYLASRPFTFHFTSISPVLTSYSVPTPFLCLIFHQATLQPQTMAGFCNTGHIPCGVRLTTHIPSSPALSPHNTEVPDGNLRNGWFQSPHFSPPLFFFLHILMLLVLISVSVSKTNSSEWGIKVIKIFLSPNGIQHSAQQVPGINTCQICVCGFFLMRLQL